MSNKTDHPDKINISAEQILNMWRFYKAQGIPPLQPAEFFKKVAGKSKIEKLQILEQVRQLLSPEGYLQVLQEILKGGS